MTCVRTVFRDAIARLRAYVPGWRDNMAAAARSASSRFSMGGGFAAGPWPQVLGVERPLWDGPKDADRFLDRGLSRCRKFWREGLDAAWCRAPAGSAPLGGQRRRSRRQRVS